MGVYWSWSYMYVRMYMCMPVCMCVCVYVCMSVAWMYVCLCIQVPEFEELKACIKAIKDANPDMGITHLSPVP
jgi:hypothetical protein